MKDRKIKQSCKFCDITEEQVSMLVSNHDNTVHICSDCINVIKNFLEINQDDKKEEINVKEIYIELEVIFNSIMNKIVGLKSKSFNILKEDLLNQILYFYEEIEEEIEKFESKTKEERIKKYIKELIEYQKFSEKILIKEFIELCNLNDIEVKSKNIEELEALYNSVEICKMTTENLLLKIYNLFMKELSQLESEYKELSNLYNITIKEESQINQRRMKPRELKSELDKYVIGQEEAKRILATAMYNHLKRINSQLPMPKSNILLIGPTGSGKTLLVKTITDKMEIPIIVEDATSLTASGYKGRDINEILVRLYRASGNDIKKAEQGVIFIDEVDKIKNTPDTHINSLRVQQELLKIIEGTILDLDVSGDEFREEIVTFNTKNILFVFSGAFIGLDNIVKKRTGAGEKTIGFDNDVNLESNCSLKPKIQDLEKYGLIPEFLGRLSYIATLNELTVMELEEISYKIKNSPIEQHKNSFQEDNINLIFEKEAINLIAHKANLLKVGGRGVSSIIDKILLDYMYDISEETKEIVITKEVVESKIDMDNV